MIKVENIEAWGFEHAIRGMRNPLNSWDRSDSFWDYTDEALANKVYVIGEKDLGLMRRLFRGGAEHRKYLRQIIVSLDITAPFLWWKEFDTYKVGTTANSCSTMHTITKKEFTLDDFSHEHLTKESLGLLKETISYLNECRESYLKEKTPAAKKKIWWQIIQLLPTSYNQKRTVTMNYENVFNMIHQRTGHKLDEWNKLVQILKDLPYIKKISEETLGIET